MTDEKVPGGWELLRGLERVEKALAEMAKGFASKGDLDNLKEDVRQMQTEQADARKVKAQQWFAIGLVALTAAASLVTALILKVGGLS